MSEQELVEAVKPGDIFYESWGYDQTQNDFCQVVRISPSGKTVICRMMGKKEVDTHPNAPAYGEVVATEQYGVEFRLKIDHWIDRTDGRDHGYYLRGSYPFIQCEGGPDSTDPFDKWRHYAQSPDGRTYEIDTRGPVSFSKWEGKPVYETPAGFGH